MNLQSIVCRTVHIVQNSYFFFENFWKRGPYFRHPAIKHLSGVQYFIDDEDDACSSSTFSSYSVKRLCLASVIIWLLQMLWRIFQLFVVASAGFYLTLPFFDDVYICHYKSKRDVTFQWLLLVKIYIYQTLFPYSFFFL